MEKITLKRRVHPDIYCAIREGAESLSSVKTSFFGAGG